MFSAHGYPSIPDFRLLFSPPSSHPRCVPSTHPGNSLAVSGTGCLAHCCQTPGTASPCPKIPAQEHSEARGSSIPKLQLIQATALCSPFKKGLGWDLEKSRAVCQEGEARWSVEVCVGRGWTPGDRDKQLGARERAALIGICRALSL